VEYALRPDFVFEPTMSVFVIDPRTFDITAGDVPIIVRVAQCDEYCAELSALRTTLTLHTDGSSTLNTCLADLHDWLVDAVISKAVIGDKADLLLAKGSKPGRIWVCSIRLLDGRWMAWAAEIEKPTRIETEYALFTGAQDELIRDNYERFVGMVGKMVQIPTSNPAEPPLLRIKVDRLELWFLRFPLDMFVKLKLAGFAGYVGCQWIVSDRSISATAAMQASTEREMADSRTFLKGSHFVINTYAAQQNASSAATARLGVDLLIEILEQFGSVRFGEELIALKWTINPAPETLMEILLSSETRFLFADFEAAGNDWQTGDGPHRCWNACLHPVRYIGDRRIGIESLRGRLDHVRLLRVFHCNSIYDPSRPGMEPVDHTTIAGRLLASKAFLVEGSFTPETVPDFVFGMIRLLLQRSDLRTILRARSRIGLSDDAALFGRANALFAMCGYQEID
jgi:hypothetical protein